MRGARVLHRLSNAVAAGTCASTAAIESARSTGCCSGLLAGIQQTQLWSGQLLCHAGEHCYRCWYFRLLLLGTLSSVPLSVRSFASHSTAPTPDIIVVETIFLAQPLAPTPATCSHYRSNIKLGCTPWPQYTHQLRYLSNHAAICKPATATG